jgi:OOP family OmpA-OmpF porin
MKIYQLIIATIIVLTNQSISLAASKYLGVYEGATVLEDKNIEFSEFPIVTGLKPYRLPNLGKEFKEEVKVGHLNAKSMAIGKNIDPVRVYYNYKERLKELGYEIVIATSTNTFREDYGIYNLNNSSHEFINHLIKIAGLNEKTIAFSSWDSNHNTPVFFITAQKVNEEEEKYFQFYISTNSSNDVNYNIFNIMTLEKALITKDTIDTFKPEFLTAADIKTSLDKEGKASLYHVYFDFDSAKVRPESSNEITEIAKFMKENPNEKLIITGHTDNVGEFSYNVELSQKRAFAVMGELIKKHGIDAKRFIGFGAGMAAPVASNATDEGRARNRRVELVRWTQYKAPTPPSQKILN